jgi:hypothetical protein
VVEQSAVNRLVVGSSPTCGATRRDVRAGRRSTIGNRVDGDNSSRGFESLSLRHGTWPVGQVVKTPPFHGGNRGSNPLRVTIFFLRSRDSHPRVPPKVRDQRSGFTGLALKRASESPTGHHFFLKKQGFSPVLEMRDEK